VRGTAAVRYSETPIHPALGQYVQLIWTLDVDQAASVGKAERILSGDATSRAFRSSWVPPGQSAIVAG
jgi:hypothetical protein